MDDEKDKNNKDALHKWKETVTNKVERKIKSKQKKPENIWFGFSVFGLIGWSVAVPAIIGTVLGIWFDEHYPREQSWTLILLLAGVAIGCFNAWYWVEIERNKINKMKDDD